MEEQQLHYEDIAMRFSIPPKPEVVQRQEETHNYFSKPVKVVAGILGMAAIIYGATHTSRSYAGIDSVTVSDENIFREELE